MTGRFLLIFPALLVLALPLLVVAGVSLNEPRQLLFPPRGLSLRWYGELFLDRGWSGALLRSLLVAATASALALATAFPLAWFAWRYRLRWARAIWALGLAPFALPPVVTALGLLAFWVSVGLYGAMAATIISHAIFLITLPLVTVSLGLEAVDRSLLEAAAVMGADERTAFRTIVLPLLRPYLIAGYAFAFVLSLNEYIIAYMVAGFTVETLPVRIFNALRYGYTPTMAAVAVLFVLVAVLAFGLVARFGDLPRLLGNDTGRR